MRLNTTPVTSSQPPHSSSEARDAGRCAAPAAVSHQAGDQQDQRGRQQPGDLPADLGVEQAGPAGLAPAAAAADAAGLLAGEPAEAVVAEGQLEHGVVLRPADVRAARRRPQLDDRDPPAAGHEHRHRRPPGGASTRLPAAPAGAATRYTSANAGTTRNACSILVRKPKPTSAPASISQRADRLLQRPHRGVRGAPPAAAPAARPGC